MVTDKERIGYFAINLRRIMGNRGPDGMTQKELEALSGVPQETISRCLNAKSDPALCVAVRLAQALDTSVDRLLSAPPTRIREKSA